MKMYRLGATVCLLLTLQACALQPGRPASDTAYCVTIRGTRTCAPAPVPSLSTDSLAKQFVGRSDVLTLYIVRNSLNDRPGMVSVVIDGKRSVATIPRSLIRVALPAGSHELALVDNGKRQLVEVKGLSGDVVFAQVVLAYGFVDYGYRLRLSDELGMKQRARQSRLIADIAAA